MRKSKQQFDAMRHSTAADVELSADEFHHIYAKVKEVILTELGLNLESVEEEHLAERCRQLLEQGGHDEDTHFDFQNGFLPLYERLHRAKKDGGESGYRLVFA